MGSTLAFENSTRIGCSSRQAVHQDAQTLSIQTLPLRSSVPKLRPGSCNSGRRKAGAALPISGEGTSRGFKLKPTARNRTSTRKMSSGRKRFMEESNGPVDINAAAARQDGFDA